MKMKEIQEVLSKVAEPSTASSALLGAIAVRVASDIYTDVIRLLIAEVPELSKTGQLGPAAKALGSLILREVQEKLNQMTAVRGAKP